MNNSSKEEFICDVCYFGKMTQSPFPKKSETVSDLLELIHTDVCGPMRVESLGKSRYFVEFIDDYSRWCEVRFVRSKSDVVKVTKEYVTMVERQKNRKVKCIQSNNGTEYTSVEFEQYLKS